MYIAYWVFHRSMGGTYKLVDALRKAEIAKRHRQLQDVTIAPASAGQARRGALELMKFRRRSGA